MTFLREIQKTSQHFRRQHHPHLPDSPILEVKDVGVAFENGFAIEDISFNLCEGERLAVVGPNGAGKSTLLKVIAGILSPTLGQIKIFGHEPGGHICIAYIPQRSQVDWDFPVTVEDVVMMGRVGRLGLFRHPRQSDLQIVNQALDLVKMSSFSKRQINQLSGGQQQRMFIARALAQEAELMLMDEPLTGLDVNSQDDILSIMDDLRSQKVTLMVSLHDLKMAAQRFNRVMLINKHMVGVGNPQEVFSQENLVGAYGGHLHLLTTEDGMLALGDTCCDGEYEE